MKTSSTIVMLVVDGLGGLPDPKTGDSELERADIPNLDYLAQISEAGVTTPVLPGITPGSGPGHMALFGYDPVKYLVGRGACEALGIDMDLGANAVAARGNFCTLDVNGKIIDRRARRLNSNQSTNLVAKLNTIELSTDVSVEVRLVQDYRFVLVLRGDGLGHRLIDTDPQLLNVKPRKAAAKNLRDRPSERTAGLIDSFLSEANSILKDETQANSVLLRGFSREPDNWPDFGHSYNLEPAAIAAYPMYKGLAKITGMTNLDAENDFGSELVSLKDNFGEHDFFFLHYKPADGAGEDADFDKKILRLEQLDDKLPSIMDLDPDVLIVAGDHSTPSIMGAHSWHPVPLLIKSEYTEHMGVANFTEKSCSSGTLGHLKATDVMILALAHAGKLKKFGA